MYGGSGAIRTHTLCRNSLRACMYCVCVCMCVLCCVVVMCVVLCCIVFVVFVFVVVVVVVVVVVCVCVCVCVCVKSSIHILRSSTRRIIALPASSLLRLRSVDRYVFNPPVLRTCRCWLNRWRARYRGSQIWVVFFFWSFLFLRCSQCRSSETCAWKGSRDSLV